MKKILPILALLLCVGTISAQNPFEKFGYTPKIGTLSKGKYIEHFDTDSIVQIGSILFNPFTKKITGFVVQETVYSEATLQPEIVSRWLTPDPLSEEFPEWSPYVFTNNNPIKFVDPEGLAPFDVVINGDLADKATEQLNASSSLDISRDAETGKLSATGVAETESDVALLKAINDTRVVINVNASSKNLTENNQPIVGGVFGGNTKIPGMDLVFAEQTVNPNHAEAMESFAGAEKGSVVKHEVLEAYAGAVLSPNAPATTEINYNPQYTQAHNVSNAIFPGGDFGRMGIGAGTNESNRRYVGGGTWLLDLNVYLTKPGKRVDLYTEKKVKYQE